MLYNVFVDPFVQMADMPDLLVQVLWEGTVAGVLYALIALGFVLIFKASGVFNFAQGIMVVFAGLTLVGLHENGVPALLALVLTVGVMYALAWSIDNRTCGFRIVGHGDSFRLESRIPGADVNPYLAYAATIAAGLHGIDNGLDPGTRFDGNAYEAVGVPRVPESLAEAIADLAGSKVAVDAFGADVHEHLLNTARQELAYFNRAVTDWERRRNFDQW